MNRRIVDTRADWLRPTRRIASGREARPTLIEERTNPSTRDLWWSMLAAMAFGLLLGVLIVLAIVQ